MTLITRSALGATTPAPPAADPTLAPLPSLSDLPATDAGGAPDAAAFAAARQDFSRIAVARPDRGATPATSPLQSASDYFRGRESELARRIQSAIDRRDSSALVTVATQLSDAETEGDIVAKVIGKSISAIDQITKLN